MNLRQDVKALVQDALMTAAVTPDGRGSLTMPAVALEALVDACRATVQLQALPSDYDDSDEACGKRLESARLAAGWKNRSAFARRLGLKPVTVRAHEVAQNGFPRETAKLYADALGVSVSWLLYGVEG